MSEFDDFADAIEFRDKLIAKMERSEAISNALLAKQTERIAELERELEITRAERSCYLVDANGERFECDPDTLKLALADRKRIAELESLVRDEWAELHAECGSYQRRESIRERMNALGLEDE